MSGKENELEKLREELKGLRARIAQREEEAAAWDWRREAFLEVMRVGSIAMTVTRLDDGTFIDVNGGFLKAFGYTRDEIIGRTSVELKIWADAEPRRRYVERIKSGEPVIRSEEEFFTKEGKKVEVLVSSSMIEVHGKRYLGSIIEDVTAFRNVEKKLYHEELSHKNLVQMINVGIVSIDMEGKITFANDAFCRMINHGLRELLGKRFVELLHPQDAGILFGLHDGIVKGKTVDRVVFKLLAKHGKAVECQAAATLMKEGSDIRGYIAAVHDISDMRRALAGRDLAIEILQIFNRSGGKVEIIGDILRSVKAFTGIEAVAIRLREGEDFPYVEQLGFPVNFIVMERFLCRRDPDGTIVRDAQNRPVLECMCGSIILGKTDPSKPFFTPGGSFWTNSTTDLLASTTEDDRGTITRNKCNREGYESVALIPLRSGGEIIGLLQLNDRRRNRFSPEMITFFEGVGASIGIAIQRKQADEKLMGAQGQEIVANMAMGVAHEVRNPLSGIMAVTEALFQELGAAEKYKPYVEHIGLQVTRLSRLMSDLLDLGRPIKLSDMRAQPLSGLCAASIDLWKAYPQALGASVLLDVPPGADGMQVMGDETRLQQVLVNLLDNAGRFSPEGSEIRVSILRPEHGMHRIRVIDGGPGISPEHLPRVFNAFFTTRAGGTGLGLPIIKRIIESHGGEVRLWNNNPHPGLTVEVRLPVPPAGS
jgi:PAS domain S-box-containing protein